MLVIISDLHLTDGTFGQTVNERAFRVFRNRLCDTAYDASWRVDGAYKPIESLDLILLGDILGPLRSTHWLTETEDDSDFARPWTDSQSRRFIKKIQIISQAIFQNNTASLNILKSVRNSQNRWLSIRLKKY